MSFPRILFIGALVVFAAIGVTALAKKMGKSSGPKEQVAAQSAPKKAVAVEKPLVSHPEQLKPSSPPASVKIAQGTSPLDVKDDFPNIDRMHQLFTTGSGKLPIVETITYSSSVPWLKGRPAWIADYAAYYSTSRHFIARSLNGRPDYFSQKVAAGSLFNVFRNDKHIAFYLLIDLKRCKMGLYYIDLDTSERVLLKTYAVGAGRLDPQKPSGCLTPLGKYALGKKVAIYKPGVMGHFQDKKIEMITVFGTRWLPFDHEVDGCSVSAKGYGIQGAPWHLDAKGQFVENREVIGKYDSDGCIRLSSEDIEELFAIVITKPAIIEVVKDFKEAKLPGIEVASPSR